jgi:hypothetical protein
MDNSSTTTGTLDQTDKEILSYTVSDEALEAAAGTERGTLTFISCSTCTFGSCRGHGEGSHTHTLLIPHQ